MTLDRRVVVPDAAWYRTYYGPGAHLTAKSKYDFEESRIEYLFSWFQPTEWPVSIIVQKVLVQVLLAVDKLEDLFLARQKILQVRGGKRKCFEVYSLYSEKHFREANKKIADFMACLSLGNLLLVSSRRLQLRHGRRK